MLKRGRQAGSRGGCLKKRGVAGTLLQNMVINLDEYSDIGNHWVACMR